jgi:hypothetical protein
MMFIVLLLTKLFDSSGFAEALLGRRQRESYHPLQAICILLRISVYGRVHNSPYFPVCAVTCQYHIWSLDSVQLS